MKYKVTIFVALVLMLALIIGPVWALTTNGYEISGSFTGRNTNATDYYHTDRSCLVVEGAGANVYVGAQNTAANTIRVASYSVSSTGTVNGVIEYEDYTFGGHNAYAYQVVPANRSTDPQLFACIYRDSTDTDGKIFTFTVTDSGDVSANYLDTMTIYLADTDDGDGFYISDGVVATVFRDSNELLVRSIEIQSDGDIISVIDLINSTGGNSQCYVFPISWPDDYEGGGWWGVWARHDATYLGYILTFYADNDGTLTLGHAGFNPTGYTTHNAGPPVNIRGTNYWFGDYRNGGDANDGYVQTIAIISGSVSGSATDTFEYQDNPSTSVDCVTAFYMGANRYGVIYNTKGTNTPRVCTFDLPADGTVSLGNKVADEPYNSDFGTIWTGVHPYRVSLLEGTTTIFKVDFDYTTNDGLFTFGAYIPPTVDTTGISAITETTATGAGELLDVGSSLPTAVGVCWSDFTNSPVITGSHTATAGVFNNGDTWADGMTGLTDNTKYYVRAYATSADGTGYGDTLIFYTSPAYSNYLLSFTFDADHISGTPSYTIQDQSANNHDGTYALAPNPSGLSGSIGTLEVASETDASFLVDDESGLLWDPPDEPDNFYEEQAVRGLFGIPSTEAVDPIADLWGVTSAIVWAIVATVLLVIVGMGATAGVHSPFFTALMQGGFIFVAYVMGIFSGWLAFSYPIVAAGVIVSRKFY